MKAPPAVPDESARLDVLRAYRLLDTPPEEAFDAITRAASELCSTPIALVSLVDESRQWFKSKVGLDVAETSRDVSFCAHAVAANEILIVPDTATDERFVDNPLVVGDPSIRFYAGVPLVSPEGASVGTLCVIDRVPRELKQSEISGLRRLARQLEVEMELRHGLFELAEHASLSPAAPTESAAELERRTLLRALVDRALDVVSIVDGTGVFRFESPSVEAVLGYAPNTRLGKLAFDFIHPDDRDPMMKVFESVLSTPNVTLRAECRVLHGDGSWRVVEFVVQNLLGDAHIAGLIVHSRDVTDRKRTEDALRESEERQRQLIAHLANVQRQKDQLLALIVHDFKNPLAAVLTNASYLVAQPALDGDTREVVSDVLESARTLQGMVADLLDLRRSEDGALPLRTSRFDLGELVEIVAHAIRPQAKGRGQSVSVEVANGTFVGADRDLVRRVLENLLVNSVKYAPKGGTIEVTVRALGSSGAQIRVADDGPGIPLSQRERIFEMYGRLERDAEQARTSHGLGLAFCKVAAEAHGGRIWVEENIPRGSCFCVELPDR